MPKYLNSGTSMVTLGTYRIEPGQTLETEEWFPTLPANVSKISDSPFYDSVLSSTKVTESGTVTIDNTLYGSYKITVRSLLGENKVKVNSTSAVDRIVPSGTEFSVFCQTRVVNSLIVTIDNTVAGAAVLVTVTRS
jgi:hypothetical protein